MIRFLRRFVFHPLTEEVWTLLEDIPRTVYRSNFAWLKKLKFVGEWFEQKERRR